MKKENYNAFRKSKILKRNKTLWNVFIPIVMLFLAFAQKKIFIDSNNYDISLFWILIILIIPFEYFNEIYYTDKIHYAEYQEKCKRNNDRIIKRIKKRFCGGQEKKVKIHFNIDDSEAIVLEHLLENIHPQYFASLQKNDMMKITIRNGNGKKICEPFFVDFIFFWNHFDFKGKHSE